MSIDPAIEVRIQEVVQETRHNLRSDFTVLSTSVAASRAQASSEHAASLSAITALTVTVADLPMRVSRLERGADVSDALRKSLWKAASAVVLLVGALNGIVIALVS